MAGGSRGRWGARPHTHNNFPLTHISIMTTPFVTVNIMGGLGNQLFQLVHLLNYSIEYDIPFYLEKQPQERKDRPYYWDNFLKSMKPFLEEPGTTKGPRQDITEPGFHYSEPPHPSTTNQHQNIRFLGYYQSYKYFAKHTKQIIQMLNINSQREQVYHKFKNKYNFSTNPVSMHFRIGDYKTVGPGCHPITPITYYVEAIKYIQDQNNPIKQIIYFYESQDQEIIDQHINTLNKTYPNIEFIPIDHTIPDYEQMLIMSLCSNHIIPNSTFSWWGAYLNDNPNKIVTYSNTDNWFGPYIDKKNFDDLCPPNWTQIR